MSEQMGILGEFSVRLAATQTHYFQPKRAQEEIPKQSVDTAFL